MIFVDFLSISCIIKKFTAQKVGEKWEEEEEMQSRIGRTPQHNE